MTEKMKLGKWVRKHRETFLEPPLTIKELANRVGCTKTTLESIERGYPVGPEKQPYHPAKKLMTAIAAEFGKTLADVYEETDWRDRGKKNKSFGYKAPKVKGMKRTKHKDGQPLMKVFGVERKVYGSGPEGPIVEIPKIEINAWNNKFGEDTVDLQSLQVGANIDMVKRIEAAKALTQNLDEQVTQLKEKNERLKYFIKYQLRKDMDSLIDEQIEQIITGRYGYTS